MSQTDRAVLSFSQGQTSTDVNLHLYPVEGTTLALTFVEVSLDSRCPTDVTCVWEGDAVVALEAVLDGEERGVELHTAGDRERDGAKHVDVGPYRIHLLGLNPDPLSEQPIPGSAYRVTLRVTGGV